MYVFLDLQGAYDFVKREDAISVLRSRIDEATVGSLFKRFTMNFVERQAEFSAIKIETVFLRTTNGVTQGSSIAPV